ncbi:MAG: CARDB domain-containing protein [Christensenellales bacterium]
MKKKKRIAIALSAMLIAVASLVLFTSTAMAAVSIGSRNVTNMFDYNGGSGWKVLKTPEHYVVGTSAEQVAYCLQHKNDSPHNAPYNDSDILGSYSSRVQTGLRIILENGYPYATGGLTGTEARYATANAVRFWLSENGVSGQYNFTNLGAYSDSQLRSYAASGRIASKIRARSGYTDVLQFSIELLIQARSQSLMTHSVSLSTPSMSISGSYFVGTSTVWLTNMNGGYTLNTSGLPSGSSVSGYTGRSGDTLTIRIPVSEANANRGFSISATGRDNRTRSNMFAYAPDSSSLQRVIVAKAAEYNEAQTVSTWFSTPQIYADLTVTVLSTYKSTYNADETVTVTATVKNQGLRSAGGFYVTLTSSDLTTQTKYVSSLAAGGSTSVTFTYTAGQYSSDKTISITATADSTGVVAESNESNNSRSASFRVLKYVPPLPDLTVTSLAGDKAFYEAGETITITGTIQNIGQYASASTTVRLTVQGIGTFSANIPVLNAGASRTVMFTCTAPTSLSPQPVSITALVDPNNLVEESNEGNNSRSATISINALRPDIEIVDSTITDWYTGMDVTVSAVVRNNTAQPVPFVAIRLTIGGASYTESIPIAGNGSNLAVFRITVPATGSYTVRLTADPDGALNETDEGNNVLTKDIQVLSVPASIVADPDSSAMEQRYEAYGLVDLPNTASSCYHTWQEVRLEGGNYVTKTFYTRLTTTFMVLPDSRIAYPDKPRQMESGFGFSVQCTTTISTNYDHPEKLVGVQMVWTRYPESAYGQLSEWQNVRDSLEVKTGEAGDMTVTWQLPINPYSTTGSRLHYTPLWYPDGEYIAWSQAFYAWSPVGQLYSHITDSLTIEGDMYDRITTIQR